MLTDGLNQNDNIPGQYRLQKIKVGIFEGERFENIPEQMRLFVSYINSETVKKWGELIRAIIAHFIFVTIHPFSDGNGRILRMLEDCILYNSIIIRRVFSVEFFTINAEMRQPQLDEARFKYNGTAEFCEVFT
ncbi:MAG: Fic family protein [Eubacteriales bacterium]